MENFKIMQEKENPFFERKEIEFSIEADTTPSKQDARKFVSEKFSSNADAIKIKKIWGRFGSRLFKISANIYATKEDKESIEPELKKKARGGGKAEEKPAEKKEAEAVNKDDKNEVTDKKERGDNSKNPQGADKPDSDKQDSEENKELKDKS